MRTVSSVRGAVVKLGDESASALLTTVAIALWVHSLLQAELTIGFFGLIHSFPVTFWLAIGLLTLASFGLWARGTQSKLPLLQLLLLIFMIKLTPFAVGGVSASQPLFDSPLRDYGFVESIVREGRINSEAIWYHEWPGGWILWTAILEICGLTQTAPAFLSAFIPLLWNLLLILPLYAFFKRVSGLSRNPSVALPWVALWIFYLGNWLATENIGAQAAGHFLYFCVLVTVLMALQRGSYSPGTVLVLIILMGALTTIHLPSALAALLPILVVGIFRKPRSIGLFLIGVVFVASWLTYASVGALQDRLPEVVDNAFRFDVLARISVASRISGSEEHAAVAQVRLLHVLLIVALAAVGIALRFSSQQRGPDKVVLGILGGIILLFGGVSGGLDFEAPYRAFFYSLPLIAYFGAVVLDKESLNSAFRKARGALLFSRVPLRGFLTLAGPALLLAALLFLPFSHFVASFGNSEGDYLDSVDLEMVDFFAEHAERGTIVSELPLGHQKNIEYLQKIRASKSMPQEFDPARVLSSQTVDPTYVTVSSHDFAFFQFYFDDTASLEQLEAYVLQPNNQFSIIYTARGIDLFARVD